MHEMFDGLQKVWLNKENNTMCLFDDDNNRTFKPAKISEGEPSEMIAEWDGSSSLIWVMDADAKVLLTGAFGQWLKYTTASDEVKIEAKLKYDYQ